jgi:16S rRNA C967 or C1407 C5-methylase (RsmB/RsmF family)
MRLKMGNFNVVVYRMYYILKRAGAEGILRRWPGAGRGVDRLKRIVESRLLRKTYTWVRVKAGLSEGMWMLARLPGETRYWRGDHEPDVQNAILAAVRPKDVVYDIGAHLGTMALGAARLVGNLGRVVAFDGDPENVDRLRGNSARNGLEGHLQVLHTSVWSRTDSDGISFRRGATTSHREG